MARQLEVSRFLNYSWQPHTCKNRLVCLLQSTFLGLFIIFDNHTLAKEKPNSLYLRFLGLLIIFDNHRPAKEKTLRLYLRFLGLFIIFDNHTPVKTA